MHFLSPNHQSNTLLWAFEREICSEKEKPFIIIKFVPFYLDWNLLCILLEFFFLLEADLSRRNKTEQNEGNTSLQLYDVNVHAFAVRCQVNKVTQTNYYIDQYMPITNPNRQIPIYFPTVVTRVRLPIRYIGPLCVLVEKRNTLAHMHSLYVSFVSRPWLCLRMP